ncbi:CoA transferase [Acidiferrimicrobium sp. IK]|uniref:CaiB/BaiF CoA transferase family protein n=1 Tax=Acidiferrimicrobium sp. IK TaxID=2871700 RepID=UPI0021CAE468|nr:CoA transferase [Acidiferrimicrobium sp. IK]MCU4183486.1 CoA transferase [Acidiferrimicrobium sp. IK]
MRPLQGIKVVEVASWTFVPAGGAVLAEWGADVLKIEHPDGGDPQRGLVSSGLVPSGSGGVNFFLEQPNHNKRSVALNLQHPDGRAALYKLCETADVFLTNWLPGARRRAKVDVEDIRAANPNIIYVRGHGQGIRGPDADKGGYDGSAFFARSGVMASLMYGDDPYGPTQPPAFGDLPGGQTIAGGIAAALLRRERTGEAAVVDVSLLGFGMWVNAPNIVMSKLFEGQDVPRMSRDNLPNPLVNRYLTSDGRLLQLVMLQGVRFWPELISAVGRPDLADDERFTSPEALFANRAEATRILDGIFATRSLDEWRKVLAGVKGVWSAVQQGLDLYDDEQVLANGYLAEVASEQGNAFPLVTNPVQFDESPPELTRAPALGEHTDDVLREAGYDDETIINLKIDNAIL